MIIDFREEILKLQGGVKIIPGFNLFIWKIESRCIGPDSDSGTLHGFE